MTETIKCSACDSEDVVDFDGYNQLRIKEGLRPLTEEEWEVDPFQKDLT